MADAYGGVLVDRDRRVLLRQPTGHFGGYVWTFAKGRVDVGETAEQAALREVSEETGYSAQIDALIPGVFAGTVTTTVYFLMSPIGKQEQFCDETSETCWATFDEAIPLILLTKAPKGRSRDLAVLQAALAMISAQ